MKSPTYGPKRVYRDSVARETSAVAYPVLLDGERIGTLQWCNDHRAMNAEPWLKWWRCYSDRFPALNSVCVPTLDEAKAEVARIVGETPRADAPQPVVERARAIRDRLRQSSGESVTDG